MKNVKEEIVGEVDDQIEEPQQGNKKKRGKPVDEKFENKFRELSIQGDDANEENEKEIVIK